MIQIERHFDATHVNAILNHPAVRPDVHEVPEGPLDVSNILADHRHVALFGEYGGIMFMKILPGVYEAHTQAVPEGRGAWIADFVRPATDWMFTRTDAFEITTRIPEHHHGARRLAVHAGLRPDFERPGECGWRGQKQNALIYSFRIQDWTRITTAFDQSGHDFHDFLHDEAARIGVKSQPHPDDPQHNRFVGISLAMLEAGQIYKAMNFYNRWAILARHPLIQLMNMNPVTIKFDIGNLIFENGTKRVEPFEAAA